MKVNYFKVEDSSVIHSIAWDEDSKGLIVFFNSGAIWHYDNVSKETFIKLTLAESVGSYFNSKIRNASKGTCIYKKGDSNSGQEAQKEE